MQRSTLRHLSKWFVSIERQAYKEDAMQCDAPTEPGPCAGPPKSCKRSGRTGCPRPEFRLLVALLACLFTCALPLAPRAMADDRLLLICMPDQDPLDHRPTDKEIEEFVAAHRERLDMTVAELTADPRREFARRVLGQKQIFTELAEFEKKGDLKTKVRFVAWEDAFRHYEDYASDPMNTPVVVQIGDTWAAYFRSRGVMPYEQQHTLDVRQLWYWKDLVSAGEITDGEGFSKVCRRLRDDASARLVAPFAISTVCDWDLLHNFANWFFNAGGNDLVISENKLGVLPWKEAVFAGPEGERAARFLMDLSEQGCVDLPEKSNVEVLEDFLSRKYAMVIMGPWVPWRAERKLGTNWQSKIGAALPPNIGAVTAVTFKGGSLMVVLDPSHGKNTEGITNARRLVEFLCAPEIIGPHAEAIAALPGNPEALNKSRYSTLFEDALARGRSYPALPEWAPIVENVATRDSIYAFWKRLSALADTARYSRIPENEQAARRQLVFSALKSAEKQVNESLSPGKLKALRPWMLTVAILAVSLVLVYWLYRRAEHKRVQEVRRVRRGMADYQDRLAQSERTKRFLQTTAERLGK